MLYNKFALTSLLYFWQLNFMEIIRHLHGIINLASLTFLDINFVEII